MILETYNVAGERFFTATYKSKVMVSTFSEADVLARWFYLYGDLTPSIVPTIENLAMFA